MRPVVDRGAMSHDPPSGEARVGPDGGAYYLMAIGDRQFSRVTKMPIAGIKRERVVLGA